MVEKYIHTLTLNGQELLHRPNSIVRPLNSGGTIAVHVCLTKLWNLLSLVAVGAACLERVELVVV